RRKAVLEAEVRRPTGQPVGGREQARTLPVGSDGPCSLATSAGHGAQLAAVFAPVDHGRFPSFVTPYGDKRAAADYAAAAGDGDPPVRASGARVGPVDADQDRKSGVQGETVERDAHRTH